MACKPSQGLSYPPISNVCWWLISSFQQPATYQHWASSNNGSSVVWWDCDIKHYLLCSWWRDFLNKFNQAPPVQCIMCGLYKICNTNHFNKLEVQVYRWVWIGMQHHGFKKYKRGTVRQSPTKTWHPDKNKVLILQIVVHCCEMIWSISRCKMIYSMGCKMSIGSVTGFITHLSTSIYTSDLSDADGEHTLWAVLTHVREIKRSWRIIVGLKQWC